MFSSLLTRPTILKLTATVFIAAQLLGWITSARAVEPPGATALPPSAPPPIFRPAVRRALREYDRFLDHHPLLEEQLRLDPPLAASPAFVDQNPELGDFLRANPFVAEGLKIYPRYYLNRALLHQASAPVSFADLTPFKTLFQQQPGLEQLLTKNPELIRDAGFLGSHAALYDFLIQHPPLARVFLPSPATPVTK